VLAVHDGISVGGFSYLEEFRIAAIGDRGGLEAEHCARGESAGAERALRHGHHPACGENFVGAAWAGLLDGIEERAAVEHQGPCAALRHEHVVRHCGGIGGGSGAFVTQDLLDERQGRSHRHSGLRHSLHRRAGFGLSGSLLHSGHSGHFGADAGTGRVASAFGAFAGECGRGEEDAYSEEEFFSRPDDLRGC
jgi:hypothetical protein